jgi:hypothetical protein
MNYKYGIILHSKSEYLAIQAATDMHSLSSMLKVRHVVITLVGKHYSKQMHIYEKMFTAYFMCLITSIYESPWSGSDQCFFFLDAHQ